MAMEVIGHLLPMELLNTGIIFMMRTRGVCGLVTAVALTKAVIKFMETVYGAFAAVSDLEVYGTKCDRWPCL